MCSRLVLIQMCFLIPHLISCEDDKTVKHSMFYDRMEARAGQHILDVKLEIEKIGDIKFKVTGFIEHFREFNTDWSMYVKVFKSDTVDGEYEMILKLPAARKDICAILKAWYKDYFYEIIKDYSNAPHYDTCPLKSAKYSIENYPFDGSQFDTFFTKGYYILSAFFSYKDEMDIIQYDIYLHVEDI